MDPTQHAAADAASGAPPRRVRARAGRVLAGGRRGLAGVGRLLRSAASRRLGVALAVLTVSLTGVVVGVLLGAHTEDDVGPFRSQLSITPSWSGDTEVNIPPLGALHLDSHEGPVHLKVQLGALDQDRTEALLDQPGGIGAASRTAVEDITRGVLRLALKALGVAVLGALVVGAVAFRSMLRTAWCGGVALVVTATSLAVAGGTIRAESIEEPRYEGLLVNAPAVVGDARRIADNYGRYAQQLQDLVGNVSRIYSTVSSLPVYQPGGRTTRVLHVSDLHLNPTAWSVIRTMVDLFEIDVVVDTGDITDWGSEPEASYVAAIGQLKVPYVYIRGNHDSRATELAVARQRNAVVLDNSTATVGGLTFAGIGDPRFTPDKQATPGAGADRGLLAVNGLRLANTIRATGRPVDLALVHDPVAAEQLAGVCPVVLAGHTHQREVRLLDSDPAGTGGEDTDGQPAQPGAATRPPTRLMVEGSTGGAGLRGLEENDPTPLALSVLYFDEQRILKAYDDIRVGGTGQAQVTLERKVVDETQTETRPDPDTDPPPSTTPTSPPGS